MSECLGVNAITSLPWDFFFKWQFPSSHSHTLRFFQDSLFFGKAISSHLFRVTILTEPLLLQSSYLFRTPGFLKSSFLRTATSSQQLFFQNSHFFKVISKEELLSRCRYFCTASTFSEDLLFGKH